MGDLVLIRKQFVKQILQEEGKELNDNQGKAIAKLLQFHSNRLMNERPFSVSSSDDLDGEFSTKIPAYGRVLDIKPKKQTSQAQDKYANWRQKRRNKAFPIYNRFVFGHYYTIAYRLMYGLTEDVIEGMKQQFETANNG